MTRIRSWLLPAAALLVAVLVLARLGAWRYALVWGSRQLPPLVEMQDGGIDSWTWWSDPGDVLVVIDPSATRLSTPPRFNDQDWSWAWLGTVQQEIGPAAATMPGALMLTLPLRRVAILTRSCRHAALDVARLEAWVRAGGVLLVEQPDAALEPLTGVSAGPTPHPTDTLARFASGLLPDAAAARLAGYPIHTTVWDARVRDGSEARPLAWARWKGSPDEHPFLFDRPLGKGAVLSVTLDHGGAQVAWRQGVPDDDFSVPKRRGRIPGIIESEDLIADNRLVHNRTPGADLLARAIMAAVQARTPLPSWWTVPEGKPAACIVTHDDEGGDAASHAALVGRERADGFEPSVFVEADTSLEQRWPASSPSPPDLHLHWNRAVMSGWRRYTLQEQADRFRRHANGAGGSPVTRLHYLDWGPAWDGPPRTLAAAGLAADASLGPNHGWGYLFGSGLPYGILDRNGRPLSAGTGRESEPLLEIPFQVQEDWGGITPLALDAMLHDAAATDHGAVVCLFHAGRSLDHPGGEALWKTLATTSRQLDLWRGSMRDWVAWHRRRGNTRLSSRWDPAQRLLVIEAGGAGVLSLPRKDKIEVVMLVRTGTERPATLDASGLLHLDGAAELRVRYAKR